MPHFLILPATDAERTWAANLLASSEPWRTLGTTLETCMKTCHNPVLNVFIAHLAGSPIGVAVINPTGLASAPYLKSIAVHSNSRSNGAGSALMDYSERFAATLSPHLFLCVSSFNTRAQQFYSRRGYEKVGELNDYIIKGASELILHKSLHEA